MKKNQPAKTAAALFLIPLLMFGFGYLMVPIYDVFCDLTGLNGKTGTLSSAQASRMQTDQTRMIEVEFMSNLNGDTPLAFAPAVRSMQVHPGKTYHAIFTARNQTARALTGQAVPSVSPSRAAAHFNKTECFCFGQQQFAPGEGRELPLVFVIDPGLPQDIQTVTLSYTFFNVTENAPSHNHADHEHAARNDTVAATVRL